LPARARPVTARSNCASSQRERAACSQRCGACTIGTRCSSSRSAAAATAGSAEITAVSAGRPAESARPAPASGSETTPSASQTVSCGASGSPVISNCGGPSAGCGANSGTMRVTRRPLASSACTTERSQMRLQAATHTGSPARASGSRAKCSASGSSSRCSSSRPSSTARSLEALPMLPLGSVTRCHESAVDGTPSVTSLPEGSSASSARPWSRSTMPSSPAWAQSYSPAASAGGRGAMSSSGVMGVWGKAGDCRWASYKGALRFS